MAEHTIARLAVHSIGRIVRGPYIGDKLTQTGRPMTSDRVRFLTSSEFNPVYGQATANNASHHCLTLGIGGKLHLAPIDTSKITVSCKEEV